MGRKRTPSEEHIAIVGDVREHHLGVGIHPQLSPCRVNALVIERPPISIRDAPFMYSRVHIADSFRFLRNNHEMSIYPFVAEHPHLTVGYALLETRNCTPFNIVRDAAAFLLCEMPVGRASNNSSSDKESTLILLFKTDGNTELLQMSEVFSRSTVLRAKREIDFVENNVYFANLAILLSCAGTHRACWPLFH